MTNQNKNYYRQRADEELAAAEQSSDEAISNIHQELARRYRDLIGIDPPVVKGSGSGVESRTVFG